VIRRVGAYKVRVHRVIRARIDEPLRDLRSTKVRRRLVGRRVGGLFFKGSIFSTTTAAASTAVAAKLPDGG